MRVGLIGAGNMASALARGWGDPIGCTDALPGKAQALAGELGGRAFTSNAELAREADVLFLCHKPDQLEAVAAQVEGNERDTTIVSILAGVTLDALRRAYPAAQAVVRVMPNVAVEIGRGVVCLAAESDASDAVRELLARVATVIDVPERLIDVSTAIHGAGPAYVALVVEAQVDAAVRLGMSPQTAVELVTATTEGSAALLAARGFDTLALRRSVTSPGGVTARGLAALEDGGLRAAFQAAADAAVHGGRR
ncbi:MAG: pyrroline-5-carboxylate reductase [Actinobacteria bacterium]|nr:pyrroline-5-carboxylate reductase [Actinomycetota bacterium]